MIAIKAVLFDWGETLVHVPGMGHSPERHIACLERLFVGDDLDNDVRGPKALGLRTAWFTRKPSARPAEADVELSDLRQLTAWCNLPSEARRRA